MEFLSDFYTSFIESFGPSGLLLIPFILFLGAVAKWKLFVKADQPGIAAIIPIYDTLIVLRMVGRPDWHIFLFLIPVFNIYFFFKVLIEIAQSFGKYTIIDYVLAIVFNGLYLFNLAMAYNETYRGPVYGKAVSDLKSRNTQLA